jgi:RNA polymerase sigma-70 factor (ECF subfamily)
MNPSTSLTLLQRLTEPAEKTARQEAWARFVRLYTPVLLAWVRNQGRQDADAADFVQEVFLRLTTRLPAYRRINGHSFRSWLFTLLRNLYRDHFAARRHRPLPGADGLSGVDDGTPPDPVQEMDEREYQLRLTRRALALIRDQFQPLTWEAFQRSAVEDRPVAEVAGALGLSADAVHAARRRVFERLREELGELLE